MPRYLDDLIVFNNSWTKHLGHLETTLEKLQEFGFNSKWLSVNGQWLSVQMYLEHVRSWWCLC